jgi:nitroreductase
MPTEACPPVRPEWHLSPEQAEHFLRSRRSIRAYKEAPVDSGRIERLIRLARYAPSGLNRQPVRWLVISGREPVRALGGHVADWMRTIVQRKPEMARGMGLDRLVSSWDAGNDPICRGAPHLVVAHAPADDVTAPSACTLALAYLELAAPAFGLGACWAGYVHMAALHWPPLPAALALPEGHQFGGGMLLGEPRYRYHRFPLRREPEITWR